MTIARIWTTEIDPERAEEYQRFAGERSLPMFREQEGYLGALMFAQGSQRTVVTLWTSLEAAEALNSSPSYRSTVEAILAAGFIRGEQSLEVHEVELTDLQRSQC